MTTLTKLQSLAAALKTKLERRKRYDGTYMVLEERLLPSQKPIAESIPKDLIPFVERNDGRILRIAVSTEMNDSSNTPA